MSTASTPDAPPPPPQVEGADAHPESPVGQTGTPPPAEPDVAPVADPVADLPPIDSIEAGTDLAPWLRAGVPAALKNAALRRKWLTTPAIRDYVDPALDYAWDWNAAGGVPGSGGRILARTAGKMARALTETPTATPLEAPPEAPLEAHQPAPPPTAVADAAPPGAPVAAAAAAAPAAVAEARTEARTEARIEAPTTPAPAPQRRHGGAAPRIVGPSA